MGTTISLKQLGDDIKALLTDIIFTNELPLEGQISTLYITQNSIYTWNGNEYINLSSSEVADGTITKDKLSQEVLESMNAAIEWGSL